MDMTEVLRFDSQPPRARLLRLAARMMREPDGSWKQAKGQLFETYQGELIGYCAMGKLAYLAAGRRVPPHDTTLSALMPVFGSLFGRRDFRDCSLAGKILHLNDGLGWPFEKIAQYLDELAAVEERTANRHRAAEELAGAEQVT